MSMLNFRDKERLTCKRAMVKSAIENSVDPPTVLRNEDRQFFHHELSLADGADHAGPGRGVPFLRHFLAGVATPTLYIGVGAQSAPRAVGVVVVLAARY